MAPPPLEDPVVQSYARCVQGELLAVWRRVPVRELVRDSSSASAFDMDGDNNSGTANATASAASSNSARSAEYKKTVVQQCKELWIFWYGDKPVDQLKRLLSPQLTEVSDGNWDNGLPYEARALLFKGLNNMIERNLVAKDFVRLGKWFVQPFDGPPQHFNKSHHLSFSFQYFIHGESSVCASVDVRVHQPVRRLSLHHISAARGAAAANSPVQVVLAPYGLSATLTGVSYRAPGEVSKLLKDWHSFYPLDQNGYFSQDVRGDLVMMPYAVEVMVAGVRMIYPTCYVLVSDADAEAQGLLSACSNQGRASTAQTYRTAGNDSVSYVEPSAFTSSNHHLLHDMSEVSQPRAEVAWLDAIGQGYDMMQHTDHHTQQQQGEQNSAGSQQQQHPPQQQQLGQWNYVNPCRYLKKPRRSRNRDKSRERTRLSAKIPFHKKPDLIDELAWALDHADMMCTGPGGTAGTVSHPSQAPHGMQVMVNDATKPNSQQSSSGGASLVGNMGPPGSVKQESLHPLPSPSSVGSTVMTPKAPPSLLSPLPPPSNGPLTPLDETASKSVAAPQTPKSVPQYSGVASPFTNVKSVKSDAKNEADIKSEEATSVTQPSAAASTSILASTLMSGSKAAQAQVAANQDQQDLFRTEVGGGGQSSTSSSGGNSGGCPQTLFKRPALPMKEYEMELQREGSSTLSDTVYNYSELNHWLNHPVKKFRPSENRPGEPLRPMYRRHSHAQAFEDIPEASENLAVVNGNIPPEVKTEPVVNGDELVQNTQIQIGQKQPGQTALSSKNGFAVSSADPYEFSDDKKAAAAARGADGAGGKQPRSEEESLFTSDGLKPTMADLDNLFDDSSDETDVAGHAPTPPDSNKPPSMEIDSELDYKNSNNGSLQSNSVSAVLSSSQLASKGLSSGNSSKTAGGSSSSKYDPTGNLPHDQLAKMFPTPPSHEHAQITSPAEIALLDADGHPVGGPGTPGASIGGEIIMMEWSPAEDASLMLASAIFSPVQRLYSDELPPLPFGPDLYYKPRPKSSHTGSPASGHGHGGPGHAPSTSSSTNSPAAGPVKQPGLSPASPMHSVDNPRSNQQQGPGSNAPASVGGFGNISSPASVSSTSNSYLNRSLSGVASRSLSGATKKGPEVNSLVLNLILSDTLLNVYRDHNFNSCTICVCTNEGNIRGRDAGLYKPDMAGDEDVNCSCGYSALINRRLAYQAGLFYEDEAEVTGLTEDLYAHRKKPSLLMLDHKSSQDDIRDKSALVDGVPDALLDLITEQSLYSFLPHSAIAKHSKQYIQHHHCNSAIVLVELLDASEAIFNILNLLKTQVPEQQQQQSSNNSSNSGKLDESLKGSCMHKWPLLSGSKPMTSEDIVRVMRALQPVLNIAIHSNSMAVTGKASGKQGKAGKKTSAASGGNLSVQGPLTWRQFHRMAGPATKGNTDDQCEPLPVPNITVGHEKEFVSLSPLSLNFWESLSLEPYSFPRDVVYLVVVPDNDYIATASKTFFKNLSMVYEMCRLGRHVSCKTKESRDGIFRIGKNEAEKCSNKDADQWFEAIGDYPATALLKLYSQVFCTELASKLNDLKLDRSFLFDSRLSMADKTPSSNPATPHMAHLGSLGGSSSSGGDSHHQGGGSMHSSFSDSNQKSCGIDDSGGKENQGTNSALSSDTNLEEDIEPPAVVVYILDPFSNSSGHHEGTEINRLTHLGLLRAFLQLSNSVKGDYLKHNLFLQTLSLDSVLGSVQSPAQLRMQSMMRGLAFSVYSQTQRTHRYEKDCKTLTGFGPASGSERFLRMNEAKAKYTRTIYQPPFVLALPPSKRRGEASNDAFGAAASEKSSVLFVNYCLSEDQHWLLASAVDDRGELLKTNIINIEIPEKARRKKASARRVGLKKLMDWILGVMSLALVPWRLVVGRIGRIGHGELKGWSVLLSKKSLKKASRQLRDMCCWSSDVPTILSACLVSMEPDSSLRLMSDQFTPDERFGQTASHCQLSTPKDVSATHILVFPTSATAQSSQNAFADATGMSNNLDFVMDLDFNLPDDGGDENTSLIDGLFDDAWGADVGGTGISPGNSPKRSSLSQPGSPSGAGGSGQGGAGQRGLSETFRYGQEEPGAALESLLQQPLALGYMVSTASAGQMPRGFWASCPHLESSCPVFLKSALHLNQASVHQGSEDGFSTAATGSSNSGPVHSLDSNFTTDVLRYVLEGYNALSWLSLDYVTRDRKSCMPVHIQALQHMYANLSALV